MCELSSQSKPGAEVDSEAQNVSTALAEIARKHHAALVRFLAIRTGSTDDAKEIAQEAYAKILALDRPGTFSFLLGYLWRTAIHLAINRGQQRAFRRRAEARAAPTEARVAVSSETVVQARERLAIVERAIAKMPPKCSQAFVLHLLEGQRFEDVGLRMGVTGRMAKIYVARALEYLQNCLDAADEPRISG